MMRPGMTIVETIQLQLDQVGRKFCDGRLTDEERDAATRAEFRAAFPRASRTAEENFMTRCYRREFESRARHAAADAAWDAEMARRATLTREERVEEIREALVALRSGSCGIVGQLVAGR